MIALQEEFRKWDLLTTDPELEDLILQSYPGTIFEYQIEKRNSKNGCKFYIFRSLSEEGLQELFAQMEDYNYALIGPKGSENEKEAYINLLRIIP